MKRASYKHAVRWIAANDDIGSPDCTNADIVSGYISTLLVADIFGKDADKVAQDVVNQRIIILDEDAF